MQADARSQLPHPDSRAGDSRSRHGLADRFRRPPKGISSHRRSDRSSLLERGGRPGKPHQREPGPVAVGQAASSSPSLKQDRGPGNLYEWLHLRRGVGRLRRSAPNPFHVFYFRPNSLQKQGASADPPSRSVRFDCWPVNRGMLLFAAGPSALPHCKKQRRRASALTFQSQSAVIRAAAHGYLSLPKSVPISADLSCDGHC
jgi:hypothetical protein